MMKKWLLIPMFAGIIALQYCAVSNARLFQNIQTAEDKSYGYTEGNPVEIKNAGLKTSIDASYEYLSRLKTARGEKLIILNRRSRPVKGYKDNPLQPYSRRTGLPIGGNGGVLDHYTLVTESGKDTLSLYLDVYHKGELKVPAGLMFER